MDTVKPFEIEQRNITIDGNQTTLRLERFYWIVLEEVAKHSEITWQKQCVKILKRKPPSYRSRAGFLRVWSSLLIYQRRQKAFEQLEKQPQNPSK